MVHQSLNFIRGNQSVNISEIRISGNNKTTLSYFQAEFDKQFENVSNISTLNNKLHLVTTKLQNSGLFDAVEVHLVINSEINSCYQTSIQINVKEKGIPFLKLQSYVTTDLGINSIGFELQAALRNPFGK